MKTWQKIILAFVLMLVVVGTYITFTETPVEAHSPLYWYGGTGNWSSGTSHWSTNSGNVPPSTHTTPTSADNVIFDSLSFTAAGQQVTIDVTANCHNMTWGSVTNNPLLSGSAQLNIYGSYTGGTKTRGGTYPVVFCSTGAESIGTAESYPFNVVTFDGVGGSWLLNTSLGCAGVINLTNGTLDTNGQNVISRGFDTFPGTQTLTLGATHWNLDMGGWDDIAADTVNFNTSELHFINSAYNADYVDLQTPNGETIPTVIMSTSVRIRQANTFTDLTFYNNYGNKDDYKMLYDNLTVTGTFTSEGDASNDRIMIMSDDYETTPTRRTITAASVVVEFTDFWAIEGAGAGDWDLSSAGEDTIDFTQNLNILFTYPYNAVNPLYYTGLWDGSAGSGYFNFFYNWSLASGGVASAARYRLPTATTDIFIDGNSGFIPLDNTIEIWDGGITDPPSQHPYSPAQFVCRDVDFTGSDAVVAPNLTNWACDWYIYGDATFVAGMDISSLYSDAPRLILAGNGNIDLADNAWENYQIIVDATGTVTLLSDINCYRSTGTNAAFTYVAGTLDTNGFDINYTGTVGMTFAGGGVDYDGFSSTNAGLTTITGENNFVDFNRQTTATFTDGLKFAADQYITNLDLHGYNGVYRLAFGSSVAGTQRQISVSGTVDVTNTNLSDSAKVGAGDPDITAGNNSDFGGNLGWIFDTGYMIYWVGNSGNWSDLTNHWSSTSGGTPGTGRVPLIQDTAVFDVNSFAIPGRTVTIDITDISGIDASAVTNTPTITKSGTIDIYGDVNLGTVTYTVTTTNFKGLASTLESDSTLTTAFYVFKNEYFMSTLSLNSNVTVSGTVYVQSGVFNHNGWNLTATAYDSATTTYNRQIILGTGVTTLNGTGAITKWNMNATKLTLTCGESTIKLTSSAANAQTFAGASLVYNNITVAGAGAYALTFSGTNTGGTMTIDRSAANKTIAGNVTWTLTDASGLVMDLAGVKTITITNTDFSMASGVVLGDYLVISGSSAAGGATFFANVGGHSTDSGGNAGWVWTPPTAPTIQTNNASDVTYLGERLNGQLLTAGSYVTFYCYFEYGPTVAYGFTTVPEHTLIAAGTFNNYLSPYKTYHYRAVVRFGLNDHAYGNDKQVSLSGAVGQAKAAIADPGQGSGTALVSAAPAQPGNMYTEGHTGGLFGLGAILDPALTAANIPVEVFWYPVAFFVAILLGFLAYGWTRTIIIQAIVSAVTMAAFCGGGALGNGLLPYWTVLVFIIEAVMIFVIQEKQNA
jgi:hypothetical protein